MKAILFVILNVSVCFPRGSVGVEILIPGGFGNRTKKNFQARYRSPWPPCNTPLIFTLVGMWKNHFQELYSFSDVNRYRNIFQDKITASSKCTANISKLTIYDIVDVVHKQKRGKATGPDGIHIEAFIYGGQRLKLYLSILFNLFLLHGCVPDVFFSVYYYRPTTG